MKYGRLDNTEKFAKKTGKAITMLEQKEFDYDENFYDQKDPWIDDGDDDELEKNDNNFSNRM